MYNGALDIYIWSSAHKEGNPELLLVDVLFDDEYVAISLELLA